MQIVFASLDDRLLYGCKIFDDQEKPAVVWSILEREEEKLAVVGLLRRKPCQMFLFNEVAVNVAWSAIQLDLPQAEVERMKALALHLRIEEATREMAEA